MGNAPSESKMGDKLKCCKCTEVLPPCKSFSDLYRDTIRGRYVYVFNKGEYYRPVGHDNAYECKHCFYKEIRNQEKTKREEERRREEEKKMKEEQQRAKEAEEKKKQEELNERLEESYRQAQEQHEKQLSENISEEHESKCHVLKKHVEEFEVNYESGCDELLKTLSSKCSIPISNLTLKQLKVNQLGSILSALYKLLFDEWISDPPSFRTLKHTQVLIIELCALSLEISEGILLQSISDHVQTLVGSISQSACNATENFLLTQALYLNLMHFFSDHSSCDTDAILIAKRWAEEDLSIEDFFLVEFLSTLTSSLENVVGKASMLILKMEIQCLKLLLFKLTHLNGKEGHLESSEMVLSLVHTNQWTPAEAVTLLKALSEKYAEDAPITEVLTLVQVYDISPEWTDDSGHTLIQALGFNDQFQLDFQRTIRKQEESNLDSAVAELKSFSNLDDSVVEMIKNITTSVLQYSENTPKDEPFIKDSFKCASLNSDDIQNSLFQLCKAVFDTKGWWPTVQQMLRWCVLVLTETNRALELVGVEEDPCVTAMFAATQVCNGNKLNIVLSPDVHSHKHTKEWSEFYKHLGISLNTNIKKANTTHTDVYEADIVYGTIDDFVSDYFQYGLEVMEPGNRHLSRGFIIKKRSLSASCNLVLSKVKENDALVFAAEILQSLMGNFHNEDKELGQMFIKALFQVLCTNLSNPTDAESKIITILQEYTGKQLPSSVVYILTILENLLKVFTGETESEKNRTSLASKLCLESLFACVVQSQATKEQIKELFQMVLNLVAQQLWSPVEVLNLLVALSDHHDENCISIRKILHLMKIYQVSSEWTDEKNHSLLKLLNSSETEDLIQHLEKSFRSEKEKSIDCLFDEIRQMENIDEQTLEKSYCIVKTVKNMITTGQIKNHTDVQKARNLSHSTDPVDLQEILAVLCNAVHLYYADGRWWPRATQMISWCLLALSDTGKLLEMGTGEGKSCVIAMFAVLRALRGEKVDVVSSSSVLCQRDAEEWINFYKYFGITADTNTNKTKDKERKECYQKDVVYGTIEAFAADHLRQIFEMKDVRTDRSYQCIIIDEVDSLLLDQGVQLTYLSTSMVSMQHLNIILAMIWGHVSRYGFLSTGHQTFIQGPPASFFKAIFDSVDTETINDPIDILCIAEKLEIVPEGFTEDICKSDKEELFQKLKTVTQETVLDFFHKIEHYVPYSFTVYTLDGNGLLCLRKPSTYNNQDIQHLTFLVLEDGLCCSLYDSEEIVIKPITELISDKIQYTPCTNNKDKISIPGFLRNLIEKKLSVWVQNAFLAKRLQQGREYVVQNDCIFPVDFRSTGIIELSKKWSDGLQQFVELKHQIKLSTISTVTNYISHVSFFENYHGKIYGTTGTLGNETDMLFLQYLYPNLSACKMPTFNRRKLFEVKGLLKTTTEEWKSEIKHVLMDQIHPNSFRKGRAALVICETINTARELYEELENIIPGKIILYSRSDKDSLSKIDKELQPGDVIVGTNLAGRGTDIKVSKEVNNNGGLFVILSFLSDNTRVELQAFGRTARKGKPGSAQVIVTTDHLQESFSTMSSLEEVKETRDRLAAERINDMMHEVTEMKLREDLFSEYCKTLQDIHINTEGVEQNTVVAILNEFWGIWLQTKSEEIDQLKTNELQKSLKADLSLAKRQSQSQTSPCSSIYHYIKFGNIALDNKQWDISMRLFKKAMEQDESWAAIAFYSHAYCTVKQQKQDYLTKARDDLDNAQKSLKYLSEECMVCLQFVKMSSASSENSNPTSLEKQLTAKCIMLSYFDENISEAIKKLKEIEEKKGDAIANISPMFSMLSSAEEDLQVEAYNLYCRGLQYVFAVEEEPHFPWDALLVLSLGLLEIVGGALLIAFTYGTLSQIGMGLITEGISDCIYAIESMVTGEFSWKMWAMEKAISVGISIIGCGIGKLIAKNMKFSKLLRLGKELKFMPQFLSRQAKDGLSVVTNKMVKNTVKYTAKKMVVEIANYGCGKAEAALLKKMLTELKEHVKNKIVYDVKSKMEKKPFDELVDSILFLYLEDKQQFSYLLRDKNSKRKLLAIFNELNNTALQPFCKDLGWQHMLHSSIFKVIEKAKSGVKGKQCGILTIIQAIQMGSLAAVAIQTVRKLSTEFFSNLQKELENFIKNEKERKQKNGKDLSENVKQDELSAEETEMLTEFRQDLAATITNLLADALVEVFHQKFFSHVFSYAQSKLNGIIANKVGSYLNIGRTEENIRAGQYNRYTAYMPVHLNSKHKLAGESGQHLQSHAEKIRDSMTAGTILDVRVLSESTGTRVVILTQDSRGKRTKMQELNPSTKPASQTVTLIYHQNSVQCPGGHYNVCINDQEVSVPSKDKSCLFHSLALGMKPEASERELTLEVARLRSVVADTLLRHPVQWEPFVNCKDLTLAIRGGDWYMLEGAAPKKNLTIQEEIKLLKKEVGKVDLYKHLVNHRNKNPGYGQIVNADHQPSVDSIMQARKINQNSILAKAMLEVATKSSPLNTELVPNVKNLHGREIPAVYVPKDIHNEFPSTKSQAFRMLVAETISQDDVVSTFKYTIIGASPRFMLNNNNNFKDFQNTELNKSRLHIFEQSLAPHSEKMVHKWYDLLKDKNVMTNGHLDSLTTWIENKSYMDPSDPHRETVSRLLINKVGSKKRRVTHS